MTSEQIERSDPGTPTTRSKLSRIVEILFFTWISYLAALVFLSALLLAAFRLIRWIDLLFIYAGIAAITLVFSALLIVLRSAEDSQRKMNPR